MMNYPRRRALLHIGGLMAGGLSLSPLTALGQPVDRYPDRPIKLIVGFSAGGAVDMIARAFAERWGEQLGQPFVVENRPGAGTTIAFSALARSAPDGYTVAFVSPSFTVNAALYKSLPYDTLADFEPIGMSNVTSTALVVSPSLNVKNVAELIALARSRPGALNYYSTGTGTTSHLGMEIFKSMTGTDMVQVPFKGTADALREFLAGRVHLSIDGISALMPYIRDGRIQALAVGTSTRSTVLPDVPTLDEAGLKGFSLFSWGGFLAPARTPRPVVNRLNAALNVVLKQPDIGDVLMKLASVPRASTPDEFRDLIRSEVVRYGDVLAAAGIERQ